MLSHVHLLMRTPRGQAKLSLLAIVSFPDKAAPPGAREMARVLAVPVISVWRRGNMRMPEAHWPASLAQSVSFRKLVRDPVPRCTQT